LTKKHWIDDLEIEEEGIADLLMDENAVATAPRPGTSFDKPLASSGGTQGISQMMRPMSNSGRPITGYARPGQNRPVTGSKGALSTALSGNRPATSLRPVTSGGR
jgi:tetratricopeptide repeat protein 8